MGGHPAAGGHGYRVPWKASLFLEASVDGSTLSPHGASMPWAGSPAGGPGILHILSRGVLAQTVAPGTVRREEKGDRKWHQEVAPRRELFLCAGMSAGGTPPTEFSSK